MLVDLCAACLGCLGWQVTQLRTWMGLKLQLAVPAMFRILFDADAIAVYERVFSSLMKASAQ